MAYEKECMKGKADMITSHANKGVKEVIQLEQKARARREQGLFVVEGIKMFAEAPVDMIEKVYIAENFLKQMSVSCKDKLESLSLCYETVSDEVFSKMSDTKTPQGILCVMRQNQYTLESMFTVLNPMFIVLEAIQDPGNLGTIFRAAEGAGAAGIIMSGDTVDIYNPKTIRSTMGSVYRMPFIYTQNLNNIIEEMQKRKIAVYAAHLQGAKAYDTCDYKSGTAFLIGNEANGLKEGTAKKADTAIRIPMAGKVESLNAAVAASVLMYEAARQRR